MDSAEEVREPLSRLVMAAVAVHELFTSFTSAGFTEDQALYLVGQTIRPRHAPPGRLGGPWPPVD